VAKDDKKIDSITESLYNECKKLAWLSFNNNQISLLVDLEKKNREKFVIKDDIKIDLISESFRTF